VQRSVILGIALSVLTAACALVEPPPPGTYMIQAVVRNESLRPTEFTVSLPGGRVLQGAVQPPSVPAGPSITNMTIRLPLDGQWQIDIPEWGEIEGRDFNGFLALKCPLVINLEADGAWGWGC
jgi:hypothetical protein